jgi:hypothetical protein
MLYDFGANVVLFVVASLQHPLEVAYQRLLLLLRVATVLRCRYVGFALYLIPRPRGCAVNEQKPAAVDEQWHVRQRLKAPSRIEGENLARRKKGSVEALESRSLSQSEHFGWH